MAINLGGEVHDILDIWRGLERIVSPAAKGTFLLGGKVCLEKRDRLR